MCGFQFLGLSTGTRATSSAAVLRSAATSCLRTGPAVIQRRGASSLHGPPAQRERNHQTNRCVTRSLQKLGLDKLAVILLKLTYFTQSCVFVWSHSNETVLCPADATNLDSCFQGNSSDSPVPSTSESSTPSGRRPSSHTPTHSRPHISYSPLICHTHPSVGEDEEETQDSVATERETTRRPSPPRRYPSEPFLVSQEDDHSPDPSGPMETLTFEAAVACSLGRSNTISSARPHSRTGWQVPNGHFRKRLAQTVSVAGCDTLSDTEEDDRC